MRSVFRLNLGSDADLAALGNRLVGQLGMVGAIGRAVRGFAAAEMEVVFQRIADRPFARALGQFRQAQTAGNRHDDVAGCRLVGGDGMDGPGVDAVLVDLAAFSARDRPNDRARCEGRGARCDGGALLGAGCGRIAAGLGAAGRLRRWTLPMTALRLTPPSCAAIWLALKPSAQSLVSLSTRSSVQFMVYLRLKRCDGRIRHRAPE